MTLLTRHQQVETLSFAVKINCSSEKILLEKVFIKWGVDFKSKKGFSVFQVVCNVERDVTEIFVFANKSLIYFTVDMATLFLFLARK